MVDKTGPSPQRPKNAGGTGHYRSNRAARSKSAKPSTQQNFAVNNHGQRKKPLNGPAVNGSSVNDAFVNGPAKAQPKKTPQSHVNGRKTYAALDLGTNNCRLLIAKAGNANFTVVDAFSKVVRLGEGIGQTGRISDAAIERTIDALHICAQKLKRRHVILARSVATEACRRATNGPEFIERVRRETGIYLDIISAEEEARLAVMGCHVLLPPGQGPALIFDIGGGSTELVLVDTDKGIPRILDWVSIPWGVVSLTEAQPNVSSDDAQIRAQAYEEMKKIVAQAFTGFAQKINGLMAGDMRILGTSGTITTLASIYLQLDHYDRSVVDGLVVPSKDMLEISHILAGQTPRQRAEYPCVGNERSDLVVAGCAILEEILTLWPSDEICVADRGIREGILRLLMASNNKMIPQILSQKNI
ncbi:hypothetical protein LPB140_10660 [Sphingorhabdus lutea]|uniref:Ppx/GppA phosphatase N-terminal domain-containing protein n=2 Tax=Sphingorhabdus lutea TaxID=1913578 RepID=A0A1L3JDG4_9SPHN|nr:hypothetical protein LPB140_10660 [Sphingorhabdus lutea]